MNRKIQSTHQDCVTLLYARGNKDTTCSCKNTRGQVWSVDVWTPDPRRQRTFFWGMQLWNNQGFYKYKGNINKIETHSSILCWSCCCRCHCCCCFYDVDRCKAQVDNKLIHRFRDNQTVEPSKLVVCMFVHSIWNSYSLNWNTTIPYHNIIIIILIWCPMLLETIS